MGEKTAKRKQWPLAVQAYLDALQDRRRAQLIGLVEETGGQTAFIDATNENQSLLSQLLTGRKAIGEAKARDIEHRSGKPWGWLDGQAPMAHVSPDPIAFRVLKSEMDSLDEDDVDTVRSLIRSIRGLVKRRNDTGLKPAAKSGRRVAR